MTEILVQPRNGGKYDDGDPIHIANERACLCVHAQHICHPRKARRNADGLILPGDLAHEFLILTHQYAFERVAIDRVVRTDLLTGETASFGNVKDSNGRRMDVRAFLARHYRSLPLFGEKGKEMWYGGRIDYSQPKMVQVWDVIENVAQIARKDYHHWPFGQESEPKRVRLRLTKEQKRSFLEAGRELPKRIKYFGGDREYHDAEVGSMVTAILGGQELRSYTAARIEGDMSDNAVAKLMQPELDGDNVVRRRKSKLDWRGIARDMHDVADVLDMRKRKDLRENGQAAVDLIRRKPGGDTRTARAQ